MDFKGSSIGPRAQFSGTNLSVGDHTFFNEEAYVDAHGPVTVGKNVSFGPQVMILTTTHDLGPATSRAGAIASRPVTIGDGVWIGARVTVLPGATIGAGAVVAAGAVVTGELPPNGLYGGVPAKLIRRLDVA
ncbi:acetyltransferase [Arthrobacter phage EvePickles]|nr:acetyltransferase [Arthrobacter phage EvePickles]